MLIRPKKGKNCHILPAVTSGQPVYNPDNFCAIIIIKGTQGLVVAVGGFHRPNPIRDIMDPTRVIMAFLPDSLAAFAAGVAIVRWAVKA
jgi:hypothetical protein